MKRCVLAALVAFFERQRDRFRAAEADAAKVAGADPDDSTIATDPAEIAVWTTVARAVLNLDETITKE